MWVGTLTISHYKVLYGSTLEHALNGDGFAADAVIAAADAADATADAVADAAAVAADVATVVADAVLH